MRGDTIEPQAPRFLEGIETLKKKLVSAVSSGKNHQSKSTDGKQRVSLSLSFSLSNFSETRERETVSSSVTVFVLSWRLYRQLNWNDDHHHERAWGISRQLQSSGKSGSVSHRFTTLVFVMELKAHKNVKWLNAKCYRDRKYQSCLNNEPNVEEKRLPITKTYRIILASLVP